MAVNTRYYAASSAVVVPTTLLGSDGSASSRSSASALLGVSLGAALGVGADQISDCIVSTCAPSERRDLAKMHRRDRITHVIGHCQVKVCRRDHAEIARCGAYLRGDGRFEAVRHLPIAHENEHLQ